MVCRDATIDDLDRIVWTTPDRDFVRRQFVRDFALVRELDSKGGHGLDAGYSRERVD